MPVRTPQNILILGGSKNVGYFVGKRFLARGATVTFLLRYITVFDADNEMQSYIDSGKVHLVQGDALNEGDLKRVLVEAANAHGAVVDLCVFSIGHGLEAPKFSFKTDETAEPTNLMTQCLLNTLCTMPSTRPRLIVVLPRGISKSSRAALPISLRLMSRWLRRMPSMSDALGAERLIAHCAAWRWDAGEYSKPDTGVTDSWLTLCAWENRPGLPEEGSLRGKVLVIHAAILTNGECTANNSDADHEADEDVLAGDKHGDTTGGFDVSANGRETVGGYRVIAGPKHLKGGTRVSRKDVAHFIVDAAVNRWQEFAQARWATIAS